MKKLAALAITAGLLLTGCGSSDSDKELHEKTSTACFDKNWPTWEKAIKAGKISSDGKAKLQSECNAKADEAVEAAKK